MAWHNRVMPGRWSIGRTFLFGLGVRLVGLLLIWLGDGSDSLGRKALVIVGVALSIGGIAVLRYLLYAVLRRPSPSSKN